MGMVETFSSWVGAGDGGNGFSALALFQRVHGMACIFFAFNMYLSRLPLCMYESIPRNGTFTPIKPLDLPRRYALLSILIPS